MFVIDGLSPGAIAGICIVLLLVTAAAIAAGVMIYCRSNHYKFKNLICADVTKEETQRSEIRESKRKRLFFVEDTAISKAMGIDKILKDKRGRKSIAISDEYETHAHELDGNSPGNELKELKDSYKSLFPGANVTQEETRPEIGEDPGLSSGVIAGIAVGVIATFLLMLIAFVIYYRSTIATLKSQMEEGVNEGSFMRPDDTSIAALTPRTPPKFLAFSTVKQWNKRPYYKQWICVSDISTSLTDDVETTKQETCDDVTKEETTRPEMEKDERESCIYVKETAISKTRGRTHGGSFKLKEGKSVVIKSEHTHGSNGYQLTLMIGCVL
ncbi:terminal uridylyltransferase 4-like protein [Labeo rohita]|uniref:Terminal uridylyltransferase 4-like protein n=1 Tax=Labeo rohita TaxID=84645 RepID=A0A498M8C6_LABRO|nr:terminal uridylyltransferase 4-like protein [Labeo rohita]